MSELRSTYLTGWNLVLSLAVVGMAALLVAVVLGTGRERVRALRGSLAEVERREARWSEVQRANAPLVREEAQELHRRWAAFSRRFIRADNEPEQIVLVAKHLSAPEVEGLVVEPIAAPAGREPSRTTFESPSGEEQLEVVETHLRARFETTYHGVHRMLSRIVDEGTPARIDRFEVKRTNTGLAVLLELAWFIRGAPPS